jgi:CNT family concentrative nucleoside transporter
MIQQGVLSAKSVVIASFALCGFANFSSIAIQIGGIGTLVPNRKADIAKLGFKAMLCGTMASYISASLAGILL